MSERCSVKGCKKDATGGVTAHVFKAVFMLPRCTFHLYQDRRELAKALGVKPEEVATRA